jgi:hypothetical protein
MGSATKAGHTSSAEEEDARHAWGGQKALGERRSKRGHSATFGTVEERELEGGGVGVRPMGEGGPADRARGGVVEGGGGDHSARATEPGRGRAAWQRGTWEAEGEWGAWACGPVWAGWHGPLRKNIDVL